MKKLSANKEKYCNNSKGLFGDFLNISGRARRLEYGLAVIFGVLIYGIIIYFVGEKGVFSVQLAIRIFLLIPSIRRAHDIGWSGWMAIIPFMVVVFLFIEGDKGMNKYGSNPKRDYEEQLKEIEEIEI